MQKAAAERLDTLLSKIEENENVGKMSADGEGVERRPYRSRTCYTLIKSKRHVSGINNYKRQLSHKCLDCYLFTQNG